MAQTAIPVMALLVPWQWERGGPELVKAASFSQTYDINMPGVVAIYLKGSPRPGVGPQDVALAIIGEVFANGYVNNKVMEFVGPGVANLSADFRIGVDVMTTETTSAFPLSGRQMRRFRSFTRSMEEPRAIKS